MSINATPQLATCPASALGPQLHIGQRPTPEGMTPVSNAEHRAFILKPGGGLWTSSCTDEGSEWVRWCRDHAFGTPDDLDWWLLTPDHSALVLVIDGWPAFDAAMDQFGIAVYPDIPDLAKYRGLDFEAIAHEYAGVHLTKDAASWLRTGPGANLNSWDCESTVWFSWVFADATPTEAP